VYLIIINRRCINGWKFHSFAPIFASASEFVVVAVTAGSVAFRSDFSPILEVLGMLLRFHCVLHFAQLQFAECFESLIIVIAVS
jgi:hypothetical protein